MRSPRAKVSGGWKKTVGDKPLGAQLWVESDASRWTQFVLALPVVGWAGWPFFRRGWHSVLTGRLNLFPLISFGVSASFVFGAVAMLAPGLFSPAMRHGGKMPIYFEAAAVIIVLVLLSQVLELRARSRTGSWTTLEGGKGFAQRTQEDAERGLASGTIAPGLPQCQACGRRSTRPNAKLTRQFASLFSAQSKR